MYVRTNEISSMVVNTRDAAFLRQVKTLLRQLAIDDQAVALAAPQLGWNVQVFVVKPQEVYINPEILSHSLETINDYEGCRSLPHKPHILIPRYKSVTMRWIDLTSVEHTHIFTGHEARIMQHETDHLKGVMIG